METSLEFLTLTEAEKALNYYENQPDLFRCTLVPFPSLCGVIWRLKVKLSDLVTDISARQVARSGHKARVTRSGKGSPFRLPSAKVRAY
jgi:hypothetical protein